MSWSDSDREDTTIYKVLVNHEEQYSIWPEYKETPLGWTVIGKTGPKAECLAYVKEVWTDMRPLSLRKKMEELAQNPPPPSPLPDPDRVAETSPVDRLCEGTHPVEVGLRPEKTVKLLKDAIDRDYVYLKFTNTKGGTELGVRLDRPACDFSAANFEAGTGSVHVEGGLTFDYVKVRCIADIDLKSLEGVGHLVKVQASNG